MGFGIPMPLISLQGVYLNGLHAFIAKGLSMLAQPLIRASHRVGATGPAIHLAHSQILLTGLPIQFTPRVDTY